jgi:hypothetical protein
VIGRISEGDESSDGDDPHPHKLVEFELKSMVLKTKKVIIKQMISPSRAEEQSLILWNEWRGPRHEK